MHKTVLFLLVALLIVPSAFPILVKLRLERAATADGDWIEVPAETLLVTPEGDLEDSFTSASAFYRMRVDHVDEEGPATSIPFEDVPATARTIAEAFLESTRDMGARDGFGNAVLGPVAYLMYTPGINGPSYVEFAALSPQPEPPDSPPIERDQNRGFILVSLTQDDVPIPEFATRGMTRTERLRKLTKSSSVRIYRYGGFLAAENENGEMVAHLGSPPAHYPDKIIDYLDKPFESYVDEKGEQLPQGEPDFSAEPYQSYQAFKDDYLKSELYQIVQSRLRQEAKKAWEAYLGVQSNGVNVILGVETTAFDDMQVKSYSLDEPDLATIQILNLGLLILGKKAGNTTLQVEFVNGPTIDALLVVSEQGALSPEQPLPWTPWEFAWAGDWSQQRQYGQLWGGSCWSGCGGTAWAMLYGWFDFIGRCDALIAGGPAPLDHDTHVDDCIWAVAGHIGTVCVFDQGFVEPRNMRNGHRWARDHGCGYFALQEWSIPGVHKTACRNNVIHAIRDRGFPAIVGVMAEYHYCLAYGYATRSWRTWGVTWWTDRFFSVNDGHHNDSGIWKNAAICWYGLDAGFI